MKRNIKLYQACIYTQTSLQAIAKAVGIENSRFSKILNGKLIPRAEEKRNLSKYLKVAQKDLF